MLKHITNSKINFFILLEFRVLLSLAYFHANLYAIYDFKICINLPSHGKRMN